MQPALVFLLLCAICVPAGVYAAKANNLEVLHEWMKLDFGFPNRADRQDAIRTGKMVDGNGIPIDVAVQKAEGNRPRRVFTTIPRFVVGVPYSLAVVSAEGASLQAYPTYKWHSTHGKDCDGITSAFRTAKTACNQMWVIDSGMIGGTQHCAPQLLLFDLLTDTLIYRHRFDDAVYTKEASLFITPIAMVADPPPWGNCQQTKVYVADVSYHGLVVHDYATRQSWRIENRFMYPDPDFGMHTVAGVSFYLMDGIFGLSCDTNNCYFHPLAGNTEYAVARRHLDNQTIWASDHEALPAEFRPLGVRASECSAQALDSQGNLYCVQLNPIQLVVWNVNTPYSGKNLRVIPADTTLLEFVSGMKVERNAQGVEELWLISNRFARLAAGVMNSNEINYRIMRRSLSDIQTADNAGGAPIVFNGPVAGGGQYGGGQYGGGVRNRHGTYGFNGRNGDLHSRLIFT